MLNNGRREDFARYLDASLLVSWWPVLRTLLGRGVRATWESAFPQLRQAAA